MVGQKVKSNKLILNQEMNTNKFCLLIMAFVVVGVFICCTDDQKSIQVQQEYSYSNQYYKNLRTYKASDHQVCFGWFSNYDAFDHAPGCRFLGLPDSLDICSLWSGIPSDIPGKPHTFYSPEIHAEMRFVQKVKGTKFNFVTSPAVNGFKEIMDLPESERIKALGDFFLKIVYDNDLDGLDMDYEIQGDWMHGANFVKLLEYLGQHIGPKGKDKSKLLIVDGYPIDGGYEYLSYFIAQAYRSPGASDLQTRYNQVASGGLEPKRYIVTETVAETDLGGRLFTDANGNTKSIFRGEPLRSIEGMARWNPTQGKKGGFGGFCIQYDYNNQPGYKYIRMGIQLQNPAVH